MRGMAPDTLAVSLNRARAVGTAGFVVAIMGTGAERVFSGMFVVSPITDTPGRPANVR